MKESFTGKTIIDSEERKLLIWSKLNKSLIEKLQSSDELVSILNNLRAEDVIAFTSCLTSEYVNRGIADQGRICYEFDKIETNNELYQQNHWTIDVYYTRLLDEYVRETGLPFDIAKKDFDRQTGTLRELVSFLENHFTNSEIGATRSINNIVNHDWDNSGNARLLSRLYNGVYLPNYQKRYVRKQSNVTEVYAIVSEDEKKLLLWVRNNISLIQLLSKNDNLLELLNSIGEDELNEFATKLSVDYINSRLENSNRIYYEFELVTPDNPIYKQNFWSIGGYYNKLVQEYMIKTGLPYEMAKKEFDNLSGTITGVVDELSKFTNDGIDATSSITAILENANWSEGTKKDVRVLRNYLVSLYLPNYNKKYIVTPGETDKTNELLKMQNEVLKAQVEYLQEQLASLGQTEKIKEKSI